MLQSLSYSLICVSVLNAILCFCRLLTTDPSQLKDELPGDLQSLSWLTSVDVPRLQQIGGGRPDFASSAQNSLLERQTGQEIYTLCIVSVNGGKKCQ